MIGTSMFSIQCPMFNVRSEQSELSPPFQECLMLLKVAENPDLTAGTPLKFAIDQP
jgi:hypothetical protein